MSQTIQIATDDTLSPLRALHSLTAGQASQIISGFSSLAATWSVARHEGCDGQLSLLIAHALHDTTLVVDRDQDGIRVSLMLGDQIHTGKQRHATTSDTVIAIKTMARSQDMQPQRHTA